MNRKLRLLISAGGLAAGGTVELFQYDPSHHGPERLAVVAKVPGAPEGGRPRYFPLPP